MSRYTPVNSNSSPTHSRRSSLQHRRPSFSSFRFNRQSTQIPDPDEMDAAFDAPPDDEDADADENHGLLRGTRGDAIPLSQVKAGVKETGRIPGDYDFERDYVSIVISSQIQHILNVRPSPRMPHLPSSRIPTTIQHQETTMVSSPQNRLSGLHRNATFSAVSSLRHSCPVNLRLPRASLAPVTEVFSEISQLVLP